jgi:predicted nucleotidyltransferase
MAADARQNRSPPLSRIYFGKDITRAVIRRFARQVANRFHPEKIILFGSHAYGKPHANSDVDILVVMPAADEVNEAIRIRRCTDHPFPLDLIVRTPERLRRHLRDEDWFLRDIVSNGEVLYEKSDRVMDKKGRKRLRRGQATGASPSTLP